MTRLIFLVAVGLMLSGCASWFKRDSIQVQPMNTAAMCKTFKPINPSRKDVLTEGTQAQINEHDVVWYGLCEKRDAIKEAKDKVNGNKRDDSVHP